MEDFKRWLSDRNKMRVRIRETRSEIFRWRAKAPSVATTYKNFHKLVNNYIRQIKFAIQNGISNKEIVKPTETELVNHFINNSKILFGDQIYKVMKQMDDTRNMALLKLACDHVDRMNESCLGLQVGTGRKSAMVLDTSDKNQSTDDAESDEDLDQADKAEFLALFRKYKQQKRSRWMNNRNKNSRNFRQNRNWAKRSSETFSKFRSKNKTRERVRKERKFCDHCGILGHIKKQCWKLYPHLRKSYLKSRQPTENQPKMLAIGPEIVEESELDQYQVFVNERDGFDFEYDRTTNEVEEVPNNDENISDQDIMAIQDVSTDRSDIVNEFDFHYGPLRRN